MYNKSVITTNRGWLCMALARVFSGGISKEDQYEFNLDLYRSARTPTLLIGVLILLFECYMLVRVFLRPGPVNATVNRFTHFLCYLSLGAVTLIALMVLLLADRYLRRKPSAYLLLCSLYALFICMWGAFLSGYSHRSGADIYVFLYVSLCVAILVPMRPGFAVMLFTLDWATLYLVIQRNITPEGDSFPSLLNSAFTALLCIVMSGILYHSRVANFVSRKTIVLQNRQIQAMNGQLSAIVLIDDLTQIHNRRYLEKELPGVLEQARQQGFPVALYMLDIDSFKQYNDLYGHQKGDHCLQQVANAIEEVISHWDAHLLRYGGEEFLVLATGTGPDEAEQLGDALRRQVEQRAIPHGALPGGVVTVSVGVCCSRCDSNASLSQLIHYADIAMYTAKISGKNRVEYYAATTAP